MNIKTQLTIGNNVSLGKDKLTAETECNNAITFYVPILDTNATIEVQLWRHELIEFIKRTMPPSEESK